MSVAYQLWPLVHCLIKTEVGFRHSWRKMKGQHKTELDGVKWSVAKALLGATRHKFSQVYKFGWLFLVDRRPYDIVHVSQVYLCNSAVSSHVRDYEQILMQ